MCIDFIDVRLVVDTTYILVMCTFLLPCSMGEGFSGRDIAFLETFYLVAVMMGLWN